MRRVTDSLIPGPTPPVLPNAVRDRKRANSVGGGDTFTNKSIEGFSAYPRPLPRQTQSVRSRNSSIPSSPTPLSSAQSSSAGCEDRSLRRAVSQQHITATMQPHAHLSIPQYLSYDSRKNTASNASQESFKSQAPLQYEGYGQTRNFSAQIAAEADSLNNSPDLEESATFGTFHGSRALNPKSSPYVPSYDGHSPLISSAGQGQYWGPAGNSTYQGQQMGMQQQYQNQYSMALGGPVGGQSQLSPTYPPGPYNNFAEIPSNYSMYGTTSTSPPPMSFGAMSPLTSYQGMPYGPGTGNGLNPLLAQPNFRASTVRHPSFSERAAVQSTPHYGPPQYGLGIHHNSNFEKPSTIYPQQYGSSYKSGTSNLASDPVMEYASSPPSYQSPPPYVPNLGGPVQSPQARSPTRRNIQSARAPSPEKYSSHQTPKTETYQLDFSSEPRNMESRSRKDSDAASQGAPHLRRQKKSMSLNNSEPRGRHNSDGVFVPRSYEPESSPTTNRGNRAAPPKMLSLLAAGGIDPSTLSPIVETPQRFGRPNARPYTDPFAPVAMTTPYTGPLIRPLGRSVALMNLTRSGSKKPSVDEVLDPKVLAFAEYCRFAKAEEFGVIRIRNIPYSVNRSEVLAFLGRNARIINENEHEPIHIVMERVTSKTLDCFVEFISFNEAVNAVNRFEMNKIGGRGGRLGQRHVEVELSSQEALMKELFPKAKNVNWRNGKPEIIPRDLNDKYNSGFQGFISKEELVMLVKHVETPQRSPFSKDNPQRPFECLISTLIKFPWHMVDYITIEDRNLLHKATKDLLGHLVERVSNGKDDINLTPMLLKRAWRAAIRCQGFTPTMKDDVACICNISDDMAMEIGGLPPFAADWKYLWTIGPRPGAPADLVLWYCAIIREATVKQLTLAEQAEKGEGSQDQKLFGDLDKYIHYGLGLAHQTLAQVAKAEWAGIEQVLRQALTPALEAKK